MDNIDYSISNNIYYIYQNRPIINILSPNFGPIYANTTINITGQYIQAPNNMLVVHTDKYIHVNLIILLLL